MPFDGALQVPRSIFQIRTFAQQELLRFRSASEDELLIRLRRHDSVLDIIQLDIENLAKVALASLYRNTNRTKEATDIYKQLIDKPTRTVSKTSAEVALAETYEADGKNADAKKLYEQIQKEGPQSQAAQLASSKLQELK